MHNWFFYLPYFISTIVLAGMIRLFFSPVGPINAIFGTSIDFMSESKWFRSLYIGSGIWQTIGGSSIIYTSTLAGVSQDLIEAAKIDGAGPLQRVKAVTFPAMKPVITFSLIMALGNILNNDFEQILLFYNSAVYEVGDVIDTWVYRVGLGQMQYGVGSAVSMLKAVISLVLILSANKISKKATGRGMF